MIYYYDDCTTCKNMSLKICREVALKADLLMKKYPKYRGEFPTFLDERYVGALSQWRSEAQAIMDRVNKDDNFLTLPFLYNEKNNEVLPLPKKIDKDDVASMSMWKADVENFWGRLLVAECEDNPNCHRLK